MKQCTKSAIIETFAPLALGIPIIVVFLFIDKTIESNFGEWASIGFAIIAIVVLMSIILYGNLKRCQLRRW